MHRPRDGFVGSRLPKIRCEDKGLVQVPDKPKALIKFLPLAMFDPHKQLLLVTEATCLPAGGTAMAHFSENAQSARWCLVREHLFKAAKALEE